MRNRALITGHMGFVGRHFWRRLLDDGWQVHGADIAEPGRRIDCRKGFRRNVWSNIDLVIHCAATIPPIDQRTASE